MVAGILRIELLTGNVPQHGELAGRQQQQQQQQHTQTNGDCKQLNVLQDALPEERAHAVAE